PMAEVGRAWLKEADIGAWGMNGARHRAWPRLATAQAPERVQHWGRRPRQDGRVGGTFRRRAYARSFATAAVRLPTSSFSKTCSRCLRTVLGSITSRRAI